MAVFSKRSLDNLKGVHPDLIKVMIEAIKNTPVDFIITDGGRTVKEQKALFAKGRTTPPIGKKYIVTNADGVRNKSNHQAKADGYYYAVDLYPYINGGPDIHDKGKLLPVIAKHIKSVAESLGVKVEWGGDWRSLYDAPHFELKR